MSAEPTAPDRLLYLLLYTAAAMQRVDAGDPGLVFCLLYDVWTLAGALVRNHDALEAPNYLTPVMMWLEGVAGSLPDMPDVCAW